MRFMILEELQKNGCYEEEEQQQKKKDDMYKLKYIQLIQY
jgi:hypothetical protein